MHLLATETRSLDETERAVDLEQSPADIVFLSFSDSDLGAMATAWQELPLGRPSLRLANCGKLRHPMSVDLYLDRVVAHARCVVVRLLGALEYWRYGVEEISALCRREGIALAIVPGDGQDDGRLAALSTVSPEHVARFDAYLREGGAANAANALRLAAHIGGIGPDRHWPVIALPLAGEHPFAVEAREDAPLVAIVFYRSHLLAGDIAPIEALAKAVAERGMRPRGIYVPSLKEPAAIAFVVDALRAWRPSIVLNATAFAARQGDAGSPLDVADVPVLQLVLSGASREAWTASTRGVSQTDLAMQVVLPEFDGRLSAGAISFKAEDGAVEELEFSRVLHRPDAFGIAAAAERAAGWVRLARAARPDRRVAIVLSDYPGGGQRAHAVGLDTLASVDVISRMMRHAGYDVNAIPALQEGVLASALCQADPEPYLDLQTYAALFAELPAEFRDAVIAAWGAPEQDPEFRAGHFQIRRIDAANLVVAIQPDRGNTLDRRDGYHNADVPPRHAYIAFYLWLRHVFDVHALLHLGTHGTLEWLPGKAAALSESCAPGVLTGGLPVIYPFIVNNPGEAAVAKRRIGAVTIGHLTPPLRSAGAEGAVAELERLVDEYAAADGLDERRTSRLRKEILDRASSLGLTDEAGIAPDAAAEDALARLDAYLCDVKDLQVRDGLHVFGRAPAPEQQAALLESLCRASPDMDPSALAARLAASPDAERAGLLTALDGRFVQPGPAGAPTRGRADVLPTGRNLTAIDPRGVPTRSAMALATVTCADLLRRYLQDQGEYPRALMLNLWGSAAMRTGGDDLALALVLLGARPVWDSGSARVTGIEILPIAVLDRPRVDVTLRISGLFRDSFPAQIALFDDTIRAIAARDETPEWNPLVDSSANGAARIYGPAPGTYGTGVAEHLQRNAYDNRHVLGAAFIAGSAYDYGAADGVRDEAGFAARVAAADAFVQVQDHREIDVLDGIEFAAHQGGFAAAASAAGTSPALYHTDAATPGVPRTRLLAEEIARVARGRLANPRWIAGMMRHGYRGAAEIARGLEGLCGFAATLPTRFDRQFDIVFDATLGDAEVDAFLRTANPRAHADMAARFADAARRGLWHPRRNAVAATEFAE
jgi:cobaltochelatase CobN